MSTSPAHSDLRFWKVRNNKSKFVTKNNLFAKMHPLETGMGVPAFLAKLWRLVEDQETNNLISWSSVSKFL
jgi:hypothetical protein